MTRPLAAVTGATGFLGQHIVRALADDGWDVRILARRDPVSPFWSGIAPQVITGGLEDQNALKRLCAGADTVVHTAGLISGASDQLHRVNAEGARSVARAARDGGRFLLVSSLAAREPRLSAYAASKRAGEEAVRAELGASAMIVRPPAVYGPGDRETLRLFKLATASPALPVLHPDARLALIHAQDAARQVAWMVKQDENHAVSLSDARPAGYGWAEVMQTAASALGRRAKLVRISPTVLYVLASIGGFDTGWRKGASAITFGKVKELTHMDWGLRPEEQAVGAPAARFDLLTGFLQTIGWYRSQGWL